MYKVIDTTTGRLVAWLVARNYRAAIRMLNKSRHYNRFNLVISYNENESKFR